VFAREYLGSLEGRYPGRTSWAVKAVDVGRTGNRYSKGRTLAMCRTYFGLFRPSPAPVPEYKNFDPQCPLLADSVYPSGQHTFLASTPKAMVST